MHRVAKSNSRRKMRKIYHTADANQIRIMMSSRLSNDLRSAYGFKSFPVHSGDTVVVTTGKFKNKEGKVLVVSRKTRKVTIDGCTNPKASGGSVHYPIDASNLIIKELALDEYRLKSLETKKARVETLRAKHAARTESK